MDDIRRVRELVEMFNAEELASLKLQTGDFSLSLKSGRYCQSMPVVKTTAFTETEQSFAPRTAATGTAAGAETVKQDVLSRVGFESDIAEAFEQGDFNRQQQLAEQAGWTAIKSPMLGTFYESSKPGADPFVQVGDHKKKGEKLCIIEAMKMMNELPCPTNCQIMQIAVKDAEIVEYGQILFWVAEA